MTFQPRMKIFYFNLTFVVAVNLQPKDFQKVLSTVLEYFNVVFCNLKCRLIL